MRRKAIMQAAAKVWGLPPPIVVTRCSQTWAMLIKRVYEVDPLACWKAIYYPLDHKLDMRSEVAVPLIGASGHLEGVLNLESPEINTFDKEDRYILQILATQAIIAIQEVRLLEALQDIAAMLYTHSLGDIRRALVERACDLLNVPASLISAAGSEPSGGQGSLWPSRFATNPSPWETGRPATPSKLASW